MSHFVKGVFGVFLSFVLFLSTLNIVLAQENEATYTAKTTFETFWPLTAGKTMDDQLYFLKTWKETLRGMLIFGVPQKAEYAVLLGTKRILETEKLLQQGKKDLAEKTLKRAFEQFDIAAKNLDEARSKKQRLGDSISTIKPRLDNLVNFLPTLQSEQSSELLQKVKDLQTKL